MKIFLICGKAGSGKDEVGSIIKNTLDKTVITGLSKYIKLFALEMTDWAGNDENKPRAFLQNMGDNLRTIREDFLTKRMLEDIEVYKKYYDNVVITDLRLKYEIDYFKKQTDLQVITIRVNSSTSKRCLTKEELTHHTETELDNYQDYDYIIYNDFSEKLEEQVINILEGMK